MPPLQTYGLGRNNPYRPCMGEFTLTVTIRRRAPSGSCHRPMAIAGGYHRRSIPRAASTASCRRIHRSGFAAPATTPAWDTPEAGADRRDLRQRQAVRTVGDAPTCARSLSDRPELLAQGIPPDDRVTFGITSSGRSRGHPASGCRAGGNATRGTCAAGRTPRPRARLRRLRRRRRRGPVGAVAPASARSSATGGPRRARRSLSRSTTR